MEVIYHPGAEKDFLKALYYYDNISVELGDKFLKELKQIEVTLTKNACYFHLYKNGFRRANFKKFPYHLLYQEGLSNVTVFIIKHNHQNPKYGLERRK